MRRPVLLLALSSVSALALPLLPVPAAAQTEQHTLRGERIAIWNLVGRLTAVPGSGDAVQVEVTRRGTDASQLRIATGDIGGRQTLRVVYPSDRIVYSELRRGRISGIGVREDGTFYDGDWRDLGRRNRVDIRSSGPGLDAHADLTVRVPRGQRIALYLAVGRAEVSNVDGDITVDIGAADLDVTGTRGVLTLDTGSGRVTVRRASGEINVDAGSGGISLDSISGSRLTLDSGSGGVDGTDIDVAEFTADVGSGGLRLRRMKAPRIDVETGSGGATLELLADVERLDIETGSGGVTVRLPATLSAEVDIATGSGGLQTDFEVATRRVSRRHLQGRIGDGKGQIRIEAGSGTVRLLKN